LVWLGRVGSGPFRVQVVEFDTGSTSLCRWSGLVVSFINATTWSRPDSTRHVRACDQVSDKVWSMSNSTARTHGLCLRPDQTRPTDKGRTCRDLADKSTTRQSSRTCRRPKRSMGLVWSGSCTGISKRHDQTRPAIKFGRARLVEFGH